MTVISETEVVRACQTLFGDHVDISRDFLYYVQPSGVKSAYRKKAKETHPDLFAGGPVHIQQKQTELFRGILQAYDVLNLFFKQRENGAWRPGGIRAHSVRAQKQAAPKASSPDRASPGSGDEIYYHGPVPKRRLQIGQYLYYRGRITFGGLIKAVIWQRKQRPSFGDIAVQWGLLDSDGVKKIFDLCGKPRLFGEKAVELGLLSVFQVNTILLYQRSRQDRLGSFFVQNRILNQNDLERLVLDLNQHNAEILARTTERRQPRPAYA